MPNALSGLGAGEVVLPGSPAYETLRKPPIARFHGARPEAIVLCDTPDDVAAAIAFARRERLDVVPRSGGHCFAGRSSTDGIVIDVSPMSSVSVGDGTVTVGAGARLGDVYDALDDHGLTIAAGCGPDVGIAGLALGGGLGILGRRYGLTCDQMVAAEVVLADGRVVECDEQRHADLFWALRGAGGGQFGVVTSLTLRTHRATVATTLHLTWPYEHAAAVIDAWQRWSPPGPDELAASLLVEAADPDLPPTVHLFGAMADVAGRASGLIDELVGRAGADPDSAALEQMPYRAAKRHLAETGPGDDSMPDGLMFSKSEFFRRPLPSEQVEALVDGLASGRSAGHSRELDLSPWGGAYNRVPADATAFPHREELFLLKQAVLVDPAADPAAARDWLARSWALVHPSGSGGTYVNFPDPDLEDWRRAYHGANYERLVRVKGEYDPDDVFSFHQSVPPRQSD